MRKSFLHLLVSYSLVLVQCQRLQEHSKELIERELRSESGFPVSFFDGEDTPSPPNSHYPGEDDEEYGHHPVQGEYSLHRADPEDDHGLFDPMEEDSDHSVLGGGVSGEIGAGAAAAGVKQDENPLNFLNLAGTDFQPGRMVNIFFGLMIMIFMIVIHGYILWIVGIAYLPGTRALGDWELDGDSLLEILTSVLDAIRYWNDMQIVEIHTNKD